MKLGFLFVFGYFVDRYLFWKQYNSDSYFSPQLYTSSYNKTKPIIKLIIGISQVTTNDIYSGIKYAEILIKKVEQICHTTNKQSHMRSGWIEKKTLSFRNYLKVFAALPDKRREKKEVVGSTRF